MKRIQKLLLLTLSIGLAVSAVVPAQAQDKKPNILFIMGDDIGWMQPSCYHRGLMVGETPNIDRIAAEGGIIHALTTPSRAAPPGATPSSPECIRYRAGMILPQLPGAISYLRPGTPALAQFLLDLGYTHRRVRQEPFGRSSRWRCRPRTASRSSGVTCITWMRCNR